MDLHLTAEQDFDATPEAVFALTVDPERFPAFFTGFGPIPAVEAITLHAPLAVGSTRELRNGDGSRLLERVTALQAPQHHAYTLTGLRPPLAWLARAGHADWRFVPTAGGTRVRWRYRWELTHGLAWPVAAPLLHGFMRTAMARCLAAMAATFASSPAVPPATPPRPEP
jgi:carbon monoxide dehydrogenase subunit G